MAPPNILVLFTDDQRFDTIGALGAVEVHTPHLDRLVERGTAFTHAHIPGGTTGAICMPSRAMLHTGRDLFHIEGTGEDIPADHMLLGEHLAGHGYRTWGTGKWHNGSASFNRSFQDGAEIFLGGMEDHWNVPAFRYDPTGRYAGTLPQVPDWLSSNEVRVRRGDGIRAGVHSSRLFCDAAIERLRRTDPATPFFMYVSFMAPHDPRTMPAEYLRRYDPEKLTLPPNFVPRHPFDNGAIDIRDELLAGHPREEAEVRRHIAEYYAMITHLDAEVRPAAGRAGAARPHRRHDHRHGRRQRAGGRPARPDGQAEPLRALGAGAVDLRRARCAAGADAGQLRLPAGHLSRRSAI